MLSDSQKLEINQVVKVCDNPDCDSSDSDEKCHNSNDLELFNNLKLDRESILFNSSKQNDIFIIVPTSKDDWLHDPLNDTKDNDNIIYKINEFLNEFNKNINPNAKINIKFSSLSMDLLDLNQLRYKSTRLLILPHFIWINSLDLENIIPTLNLLIPEFLNNTPDYMLMKYPNLLSCTLFDSFVFICSHTTRDKRCGKTAPILKKNFNSYLSEYPLISKNIAIEYINHVGGHKFAANVLIFTKKLKNSIKNDEFIYSLIWLGRFTPLEVEYICKNILLVKYNDDMNVNENIGEKLRCVKKFNW